MTVLFPFGATHFVCVSFSNVKIKKMNGTVKENISNGFLSSRYPKASPTNKRAHQRNRETYFDLLT